MRVSESENFDPQRTFIMEDQTVLEREKKRQQTQSTAEGKEGD